MFHKYQGLFVVLISLLFGAASLFSLVADLDYFVTKEAIQGTFHRANTVDGGRAIIIIYYTADGEKIERTRKMDVGKMMTLDKMDSTDVTFFNTRLIKRTLISGVETPRLSILIFDLAALFICLLGVRSGWLTFLIKQKQ